MIISSSVPTIDYKNTTDKINSPKIASSILPSSDGIINDIAIDPNTSINPSLTAGQPGAPSIVLNTDPHGPTIVKNTNDQSKGLFTFPAVGAMVWVFFREGNPQYPVYFAASYGTEEWKSAYGSSNGINGDGTNVGNIDNQTANSLKFIPNAGGGLEFTHIKNNDDPSGASDRHVAMMYGDDGSNMVITKGYHQIYTRHDRRDQIDGDSFNIIGGNEEKWVEGESNLNIRGNHYITVGKITNETLQAMNELAVFSKQMNSLLIDGA